MSSSFTCLTASRLDSVKTLRAQLENSPTVFIHGSNCARFMIIRLDPSLKCELVIEFQVAGVRHMPVRSQAIERYARVAFIALRVKVCEQPTPR